MVTLDMNAKVVQHVPRIKLDNLTLLSIDMKTKVVQHVPWINLDNLATRQPDNFTGSQRLSDFQTKLYVTLSVGIC